MNIRCNLKFYEEYNRLLNQNADLLNGKFDLIRLTLDNEVDEPVIMAKMKDGSLHEWTRGYENIKSFLINGYVKIIHLCPFNKFAKCKGVDCQLYLVKNFTGDCSLKWSAILSFDR
jgi:hypothetical protein